MAEARGFTEILVRDALFLKARLRYETVPEVLPYGPVFFQVDENAHFAALLVGDILDSGHGFIFLQMTAPAHFLC